MRTRYLELKGGPDTVDGLYVVLRDYRIHMILSLQLHERYNVLLEKYHIDIIPEGFFEREDIDDLMEGVNKLTDDEFTYIVIMHELQELQTKSEIELGVINETKYR